VGEIPVPNSTRPSHTDVFITLSVEEIPLHTSRRSRHGDITIASAEKDISVTHVIAQGCVMAI
jgi:hypothetical protein